MSEKLKKLIKLSLCFVFMLLAIYLIHYHYTVEVPRVTSSDSNVLIRKDDENRKLIESLVDKYDNNEIVSLIKIPNVLEIPVVQTEDNNYYLSHDLYKDSNEYGTVFLDYRNKSLNDKKIIMYGKKDFSGSGYSNLEKYADINYYNAHSIINLTSEEFKKSFKIFSVFVETEDFDYTNLNSYNGLTYFEHITKLKDKSLYNTEVDVDNNSRVIVLELLIPTTDGSKKTMVVVGVELPKEKTVQ